MAYKDFIQCGLISQSSSLPGIPGPAPRAVSADPPLACRSAGRPGHPPWALASPFSGLPYVGGPAGPRHTTCRPAPARLTSVCLSLKRPADHRRWAQARPIGLPDTLEGLLPTHGRASGPTAEWNRGRPRQERPCAGSVVAPGPLRRRFRGLGHPVPLPPEVPIMINEHAMTSVVAGIIVFVLSLVLFCPMAKGRRFTL